MGNATVFSVSTETVSHKKITQREVEMKAEIEVVVLLWSVRLKQTEFMTPGIFFCKCHSVSRQEGFGAAGELCCLTIENHMEFYQVC